MQNVDLKILEDILTLHLFKDKGELYFELLTNEEERERFLSGIRKIILFENILGQTQLLIFKFP